MGLESNNQSTLKSIEQQANFGGNWTEVLFDRMHDPMIRKQLVDLVFEENQQLAKYYSTESFEFDCDLGNGDKLLRDKDGRPVFESEIKNFKPQTREEVEKSFDERLENVMKVTPIDLSPNSSPSESHIPVKYKDPMTGKNLDDRQMSMVVAHEKGHTLRPYIGSFYDKHFAGGFDESKIAFSDADIETIKSMKKSGVEEGNKREEMTDEEIIEETTHYLTSVHEIAERMAQLKNYFGMKGSEEFTHEHLEYARKHYIEDVGVYNFMEQFFQAITPETEPEFLKLINSSGI